MVFHEGRHAEKNQATMRKNTSFFSVDFSSIFREKSTENHAKRVETSFVHKNRRKSTFGTSFFSKQSIFSEFLGSPRVPRAVPENLQNRSFFSFMVNCARKRARAASGRPQEGPGGPPRRPQGTILRRFSDRFCTSKTNENIQKVLKITQKILKNS